MANTYTQLFLHVVFAVKCRNAIIPLSKTDEIYGYMAGIINKHNKCKAICIGGTSDHIHMLLSLSTTIEIADLVQSIKIGSTNYINDNKLTKFKFSWQVGYGAFSVSATHVNEVKRYITGQIEHHLGITFLEEYKKILEKNNVEFEEDYIFTELE